MRKKNNSSFITLFLMLALVAGGLYIYFSSTFERVAPQITLNTNGFWNFKEPLHLNISDESGVKAYRISMKSSKGEQQLQYEQLLMPSTSLDLEIEPPKGIYALKDKKIEIVVEAIDASKWNLLKGNDAKKEFALTIDKKRPNINIINNSYKISRGGAALVIFSVNDENLEEFYILGNHDKKFKAQPFYKEGYYIALIAWPVIDKGFKATVVARDSAGNTTKSYVPFYLKDKTYKLSKIDLSDKFLKGKIYELSEEFEETQGIENSLEQFKIINEDVRAKNEKLIHEITSKVSNDMISDFKVQKIYPLKNGQVVAHFGDHRQYYYNHKFVSEAYHLGIDLASYAMAPTMTQNGGEVVFTDYNGLYGNMPIISHGLGLYTLYGHCSSIDVSVGEHLPANTKIANTGKTGYAMGDHLHFGVLVQGIEVRPQEWMDSQWIKLNISDIIKESKKIIDQR
ncbi:M23 family metallopeptidase [Sulfurimonas sp.]|uniref:M23 family metallopeptidase n=1 Tax=Sulfurimonas sp. TaxID=2022749 RepID=UPI003D09E2C8